MVTGATILPFKPALHTPWDGDRAIVEALRQIADLAALMGSPDAVALEAANQAAGSMQAEMEAPDCYFLIGLDGRWFGSRDYACRDTVNPAWHIPFRFYAIPNDDRILAIRFMDSDLLEDDPIGAISVRVGDLFKIRGSTEQKFLQPDGTLTAGGLVLIRVTVTRE